MLNKPELIWGVFLDSQVLMYFALVGFFGLCFIVADSVEAARKRRQRRQGGRA